MLRKFVLAGLSFLLMLTMQLSAAEKLKEGNWKLGFYRSGTSKANYFLLKIENKDNKPVASLASTVLQSGSVKVNSFTRKGDEVVVKMTITGEAYSFEGTVTDEKTITGNFGGARFLYPAELTTTELKELTRNDVTERVKAPALQQANQLVFQPRILRAQAGRATGEAKQKLLKQAEEAQKKADAELPKVLRTAVDQLAGKASVFSAIEQLLNLSSTKEAKAEDVNKWVSAGTKTAKKFGSRWEREFAVQSAQALVKHNTKELAEIALNLAGNAQKALGENATTQEQVKVLKVLAKAQEISGKEAAFKKTQVELTRLENVLDTEYEKKVPPFKVEKFKGRKGKSKRVVVMELFTGAQCPPCVAADVAFDALEKTYAPKDVVLLQYHLHIPGPDPLTNSDTIARQKYYGMLIRGTPSTLFNGKSQAGGGGGMTRAAIKYNEYREVIDAMLEQEPAAKLTAKAVQDGDEININVEVDGLKELAEKKLRIVLVEEKIRYVGGNGLRFHHNVVRDFPGGVGGKALKDNTSKHQVTVSLKKVQENLKSYLASAEKTRTFPNTDRPLDLKNLHVVAFVQDDKTQEILQAVQVEVEGK